MNGLRLGAAFALAAAIAIGAGAGAPPGSAPRVLAAGNASHLWIVARNEGRVKLFHAADTMEPGTMREAAILAEGMPIDIAASGTRVDLLFPARSAILPRAHILSTSTRQHPASGRWLSVPADRLELMPALPEEKEIESFASSESGPMLLHAGSARLWRLERGEWQAIDLPRAVAEAPARRIERRSKSTSVLARSGPDGGWERWTHDDDGWRRVG
ncbi:MAG: hypothetical protein FJ253_06815, partial [Phycisphaerae bacterium]|nr:hypothetical protein [Phycisphaerae bacterium]